MTRFAKLTGVVLLALLLAVAGAPIGQSAMKISTPEALIGRNSPIFNMKTVDGKQYGLRDEPGYVYVLEFWTISCASCKAVPPVFQQIHTEYAAKGVRAVGVNIADTPAAIKRNVQTGGYTFDQVADQSGTVTNLFKIYATPTIIVIDRKGVVRDVMIGLGVNWSTRLTNLVATLVAEQ
ncbi:MAG: Thiol-disulfide oxidoreductase ResA [Firmicutes bacterium ADurb.Bin506]|jgi:cytochrome c biogenesis protein CcmG/thiol:disulfide interchange protein DsbE|nr:MAG: Thiol-disulfide oxidoreductase ResA [Firmicutes bacterium ADurb.Bin506]